MVESALRRGAAALVLAGNYIILVKVFDQRHLPGLGRGGALTVKKTPDKKSSPMAVPGKKLLSDLRVLILEARSSVARTVNAELTLLYWHIGFRIRQDILKKRRAAYGQEIVAALRRELGWTHFKQLIPIGDPLKLEFYAEMCRMERWSTRTLNQ